jgi:putative transcriptional regulator
MENKIYKSNAFAAIHSSAKALLKVGAINKATIYNFDETCLAKNADCLPSAIEQQCILK